MKRTKLTYESITSTMIRVCQKYGIVLVLNDPTIPKDNGCSYGSDEIHMGKEYKNNLIFLAIFTHELGHCLILKKRLNCGQKLTIFHEESLAWTVAMRCQLKYFKKSFTKSQGNFMLDCLSTYSKQHYHFSKSYSDKEEIEE